MLGLEPDYALLGALMGEVPVCGRGSLGEDGCARGDSGCCCCGGGHRVLGGNIGMGGVLWGREIGGGGCGGRDWGRGGDGRREAAREGREQLLSVDAR